MEIPSWYVPQHKISNFGTLQYKKGEDCKKEKNQLKWNNFHCLS